MSKKVKPDSLKFGETLGEYTAAYAAEYIPPDPNNEPADCKVPPEKLVLVTHVPLIELNPSCAYEFPEIIPIPPVFNPKPVIPEIIACKDFDTTVNIQFGRSTRKAGSYISATPIGPNNCGLILEGLIDVLVCEDFTATTNVIFKNQAKGNLLLKPTKAPDCGVNLTGIIDVEACVDFNATTNVVFGNSLKKAGSLLKLTPSKKPNCGVDLTGVLDLLVCEEFKVNNNLSITGPAVKQKNISITPLPPPICGVNIAGNVDIQACVDFTASGSVTVGGMASGSITVEAQKQPNCGVVISGNIFVPEVDVDFCKSMVLRIDQNVQPMTVTFQDPDKNKQDLKVSQQFVVKDCSTGSKSTGTLDCCQELRSELKIQQGQIINIPCVELKLEPKVTNKIDLLSTDKRYRLKMRPELKIIKKKKCLLELEIDLKELEFKKEGKKKYVDFICSNHQHGDDTNNPDRGDPNDENKPDQQFQTIELDTVRTKYIESASCCSSLTTNTNKIDLCNGQIYLENADEGGWVNLEPEGKAEVYLQCTYVCRDGEAKKAWVLMGFESEDS
jgi:hypothetical protein